MRRLPPLTALPAFEATARLGSVTAAAEELGRTHGAVSKQIKHLSEDLGVELFEKDGVGLKLTREGARLRDVCGPLLDQLSATWQALAPDANPLRLSIGVSATFAMRWLTPRLPQFYAQIPGAEVDLRMAGRSRLSEEDVDAVLTYDRLNWAFSGEKLPSARGKHYSERAAKRILGDVAFGPVCAANYPIELFDGGARAATGVHVDGGPRSWETWSVLTDLAFEFETSTKFPHTFLGLEAAAAGMGVAMAERRLVEQDLAEGRLIAPLGFSVIPDGFGAHISKRSIRRRIVNEFLDWVERLAAENVEGA
ncbi:MAG: LysR substrate-binding domain-containing protein [Neomegalonema sp.]|nr:LysR substrate-binding domain-containing protein [Neomegalonema sp.]